MQNRIPGLDGLRAVAVLTVFAHHAFPDRFPGGFLGVDLFFALSGFLITTLLLRERAVTGGVRFGRFYLRRALRLMPALVVMVVLVTVWATVRGYGAPLREAAAALTYTMDLYAPAAHDTGGIFGHTWSLAVEEQFYIVWPALLVVGLARGWRMGRAVLGIMAGLTVASALLIETGSALDVYRSPIPHLAELGAGVALAFTVRAGRASDLRSPLVPLFGVGGFAIGSLLVRQEWRAMYWGGFTVIGIAAAALVGHVLLTSAGWVVRLLTWRPAVWLGERSYGFYLWHYPLLIAAQTYTHSLSESAVIALLVTLAVVETSWRAVEQPFLKLKDRKGTQVPAVSDTSNAGRPGCATQ